MVFFAAVFSGPVVLLVLDCLMTTGGLQHFIASLKALVVDLLLLPIVTLGIVLIPRLTAVRSLRRTPKAIGTA